MNADKWIRGAAAGSVLLVAAIAAVVSFLHIQHLAVTHGQTELAAMLLPVSVDGTVAAASLVLLYAARNQIPAPWLARFMLGLGVLATLAANVAFGAAAGVTGALISGWPGLAFVLGVELILWMVRQAHRVPGGVPGEPAASNGLSQHLIEAQRRYAAEVAAGTVPAIRRIRSELAIGQDKAQQVRAHLAELART